MTRFLSRQGSQECSDLVRGQRERAAAHCPHAALLPTPLARLSCCRAQTHPCPAELSHGDYPPGHPSIHPSTRTSIRRTPALSPHQPFSWTPGAAAPGAALWKTIPTVVSIFPIQKSVQTTQLWPREKLSPTSFFLFYIMHFRCVSIFYCRIKCLD